jgi:hypothetical protein
LPSSASAIFAVGDVVAALRVAHEVVGAVAGPFDGLAQLFRSN